MKIAIMTPTEKPIPTPDYGGAERCIDAITRQLVSLGHTVDLFCAYGSTCPATELIMSEGLGQRYEKTQYDKLFIRQSGYDVIIDHSAYHIAGRNMDRVVSIMGGDPYKRYPHDEVRNRVYKSKEFASFNGCRNHPVMFNLVAFRPEEISYAVRLGSEYVLYAGTIDKKKGVDIAAKACKLIGKKLKVAGPIRELEYWETFKDDVEYLGVIGGAELDAALRCATVFIHPVQCVDCNPQAPKEAMLRGTPVVATPVGGLLSIVDAGISG